MAEITYKIKEKIGIISSNKGWNKELNLISWNGKEAKFDLRSWTDDYTKMSKGVTLTKDELISLRELLNSINLVEALSDDLNDDDIGDDLFENLLDDDNNNDIENKEIGKRSGKGSVTEHQYKLESIIKEELLNYKSISYVSSISAKYIAIKNNDKVILTIYLRTNEIRIYITKEDKLIGLYEKLLEEGKAYQHATADSNNTKGKFSFYVEKKDEVEVIKRYIDILV